jgi:DNA processing protein
MPASVDERYRAALALAYICHSGGNSILRLLKTMSPEDIWAAPQSRLTMDESVSEAAAQRFVRSRRGQEWREAESGLKAAGLRFVPFGTSAYPQELTNLSHPPVGLFVKGDEEKLEALLTLPRITIVGTRRATAYGTQAARDFAAAFAARGIAVVSGMALGVDGRSHEAALEMRGLTAAVLGCGADIVYPRRHRGLYQRIVERGLVMSELPPGAPPAPWTFPNRNRLLAALGDAVVVVEGSPISGAMQTADQGASLGRPVFAVPGSIYVENHRGCNLLLRDGAVPALDPDMTVEEFLLQTRIERGERRPPEREAGAALPGSGQDPFRELVAAGREAILEAIAERPHSVDALVVRTGMTARHLTAALAELELGGLAARAGPGLYIRAP